MFERWFQLSARGTSVAIEIRAGLVTFLTMSYILFVNPQVLSEAGLPAADVAVATALAAAVATLAMGLLADYPFALAPGMGLNAYFTYGVVLGMGIEWQVALAAVFIEGVLFLLLAFGGVRSAILRAIPQPLKLATMGGIGLFLAIIGFQNAGWVVDHPATLVTAGDLSQPAALLALGGLLLIAGLMVRQVRGAILIGIVTVTIGAWLTGVTQPPQSFFSLPQLPKETLFAVDFSGLLAGKTIMVIAAFLFVDIFDTAGTLIGVGRLAGLVDENGELPRADRAFAADALGTSAGALFGTSTVTSYVESATGVEEGGRTGLTAVVVSGLFLLSLFFVPILIAVPAAATAPALVAVGALMLRGTRHIDWNSADVAVPSFLTMVGMPLTYSIANGISLGIVSWVVIKSLAGRAREIHPLLIGVALALALFYGFR